MPLICNNTATRALSFWRNAVTAKAGHDDGGALSLIRHVAESDPLESMRRCAASTLASLTGENAGKLMTVVEAPNGNRLGAMLDELESDWASAILGDMAQVRQYEHGFTMNCRVVYAAES